ncbi:MAG: tripartite tricarboxylate transporter TctB family protein [Peptococcaceae bacterium]
MNTQQRGKILFNVSLFFISLVLYYISTNFKYTKIPGRLGPDLWPKLILIIIIIFTAYDIVLGIINLKKKTIGKNISASNENHQEKRREGKNNHKFLILGLLATFVYILLLPIIGFIISTVIYLAGMMKIGNYKRRDVIICSSLIGTFCLIVVFLKIAYLSLPAGIGFFGNFTYLIYSLLGIR